MVLRRFVRSQCEILSKVAESASLKQVLRRFSWFLPSLRSVWAESGRDYAPTPTSFGNRTRL